MFVVGLVLSGSSPAATEVIVVGTVHDPTRNILKHARDFAGKRIVVLCGLEHRGYLRSRLTERAAQEGLVVREF